MVLLSKITDYYVIAKIHHNITTAKKIRKPTHCFQP